MGQKSNYKILCPVGKGRFGQVFAAIDRKSGSLVAFKELQPQQFSTSSCTRQLNFLLSLNHFNLVNYIALEHRQDDRYLVMDYCEGGSLRSLLDNSPQQSFTHSLQLVTDILSGLEFAHAQSTIHLDIKPENILLKVSDRYSEQGNVSKASPGNWTAHISDLGIAKLHQETNQSVIGSTSSLTYMAPEQFYGEYSYSCDLYAVGVILYELVVGEPPFSGMPRELLAAHLNQSVVIPNHIPFQLRSAIAKSLQKSPHRRFSSAAEMLRSLQLVQAGLEAESTNMAPLISPDYDVVTSSPVALDYRVSQLTICENQVYLARDNRLALWQYSNPNLVGKVIKQYALTFDSSIRFLKITSAGCFISTASSIYFIHRNTSGNEFFFVNQTLLPIAVFPTDNLVQAIDSTGSWLVVSYLPSKSKTSAWEIFQLPNCQQRRTQVNRAQFDQIIALNRRHGLGIYQNQAHHTELHLFNRRGNWLANFTLHTQLDLVAHNPRFPRQLLVTEKDRAGMVVLIFLDRFKVERITLDFTPSFIICCTKGYLLSDRQGKMSLLDHQGKCIRRFQTLLSLGFEITAIAVSETLLVASACASQFQLQRFSWH